MSTTAGDFLLKDGCIKRIYGYPGDGINGIPAAFAWQDDRGACLAGHT